MRPTALRVLTALLVAACSAAPAASSAEPSGMSVILAPPVAPSFSPAVATPTASPQTSAEPIASPPPSVAPIPSPTHTARPSASLPVVGAAPSGPWSALHWLKAGKLPLGPTGVTVHGWNGGYVAFEQSFGSDANGDEVPVVIRASGSSDGVHWSSAQTLETRFKGMYQIASIVEGPAGLLALGYPYGDTCGGPEVLFALWRSSDGRSWTRLPMPKAFTTDLVETVSGGAHGYIAFGTKSDRTTPEVWTSEDAATWTSRALPAVASGTLVLDGAVSFDAGYLLVGGVLGDGECGGPAHLKRAAWFSSDGAQWTRASLPGASTDPDASLLVRAWGGRVLIVQVPSRDSPTDPVWSSGDGLTWVSAGTVSRDLPWSSVSDGHHLVLVRTPQDGVGPLIFIGVDPGGHSTTLTQSGEGPAIAVDGPQPFTAVGPTGVLDVLSDGRASWIGVPR